MSSDETGARVRLPRRSLWLSFLALLVLCAASAVTRVRVTLDDPHFDAHDSSGILKSDPGLLYYLVERVIDAHGAAPADWRADPRIEHPATYDVPARLPVAQEFVVAWLRLALGDALPLHVFCLWVTSACASLVLVGTWLLAYELTLDAWLALLAALFAALLPATMRTTGFVLMDEDFSLPFLALHLGFLARAVRVRTPLSITACALALGCALATWHATSFLVALEALCVAAVCLRTGANPMRARGAWIVPAVMLAFGLGVPFLRATGFVFSVPMVVVVALWCAARAPHSSGPARQRVILVVALAVSGAVAFAAGHAGGGDYAHVFGLVAAKLANFGVLPADPRELSPDVRLMWQGPFETLDLETAIAVLGLSLLVVPFALREAWQSVRVPPADPRVTATALLACVSVVGAWLVMRVVVLPAIVLPALAAVLLARSMRSGRARIVFAVVVLVQGALLWSWLARWSNPWYAQPPERQTEIAAMVRAVERWVPAGAAVASDSINSTAILAQTRRPVLLSPKWESSASRKRVVDFTLAFFTLTPAEFRAMLVDRYRCEWLLVDRWTLGSISRYAAGLKPSDPWPPRTSAAAFLVQDEAALTSVPGYTLVWRSPATIRAANGAPTDFFRLYHLAR